MENDGVFKGADLSTGCWTNGCAYRFNCTSYAQMTKSVTMANEFTVQQVEFVEKYFPGYDFSGKAAP